HQIYDLEERNAEKKAEIDGEIKHKERRLECDLREFRIVVAVKSQGVRVKQNAVQPRHGRYLHLESDKKS
ncbi:UNVERIFIED_CONTAM: hypothetical protein HDU68_011835, partial [Siphonaria sp. JEL0065]